MQIGDIMKEDVYAYGIIPEDALQGRLFMSEIE